MSDRLPTQIEPYRLAKAQAVLRGDLALATMSRLADLLASDEGDVAVDLHFGIDPDGIAFIAGHVSGRLMLQCQRCLQAMPFDVDVELMLGAVASEAQVERLPERYEPLVVTSPTVSLSAIVEDEIILSLPIVTVHDDPACQPANAPEDEMAEAAMKAKAPNPFAVLAELKTEVKRSSED